MKVLIITAAKYGPPWDEGVNNIVRRLVEHLANRGNEVNVIASGAHSESEVGEYGEIIHRVAPATSSSLVSRTIRWLKATKELNRVAKEYSPDVSLAFYGGSLFLGFRARFLKYLLGSRFAIYIPGLNNPLWGISWFTRDLNLMIGSPFLYRWYGDATLAYPVTPVHLKPVVTPPTKENSDDAFSILFLGTAQKERGVEFLLEGVALANQTCTRPIHLTLAFNGFAGRDVMRVMEKIDELNLSESVSLLGHVNINDAYQDCDVVVIPRQEPIRMSFPVRILEALSYNKPLIVSSMCEMGQLIEGCGMEVDPTDPVDLAQAIITMAEDSETYQTYVDNCPALLETYDSNKTLEIITAELERLADE